jgi:hydrogenase nickel incorporation protein HypA/HybF
MHEYGIAVEIADTVTKKAAGRPVAAIALRIGALSGISSDSVTMYLELIFKETANRIPRLAVEPAPASLQCSCGERYSADTMFDPCPACGGYDRTVIDGSDCTIESIEVDDE